MGGQPLAIFPMRMVDVTCLRAGVGQYIYIRNSSRYMAQLKNPTFPADGTRFAHVRKDFKITIRRDDSETGLHCKVSIARLDASNVRLTSKDWHGTKSVVMLNLTDSTAELIQPILGIDAQADAWTAVVIEKCVEFLEYYE